ncbi:hypothetical protein U1Q18_044047 [Sarracenia purpurea var. burkii]
MTDEKPQSGINCPITADQMENLSSPSSKSRRRPPTTGTTADKIWTNRLRVVSCKDRCEIWLEDPNSGELFGVCFVHPGERESSVESVLDSSRYFVLKIISCGSDSVDKDDVESYEVCLI